MEDTIFKENRLLRRKLDSLLRQARTNEKKQELFDSFGFEIIASNSPAQLRDMVLFQMQARFQLVDVVLCVVDYDNDADRLFYGHDEDAREIFGKKLFILHPEADKDKVAALCYQPLLGQKVLSDFNWMISGETVRQAESAAFLPLIRSEKIIGALLLISQEISRYQSTHGTEFLRKLSAMTAIAIENCLNQQRLKEIGYQDVLTQAYNRRYFDLRFNDEIECSMRKDENLACMFLDIDFFKQVNDEYGHHIGDLVLMKMVATIKEQVRACDIVARYGGEEFVVALPATSAELAQEIAERLRIAVFAEKHFFYDKELNISISIGLATLEDIDLDAHAGSSNVAKLMLDYADRALYAAKENGRNQIMAYMSEVEK
jgi:diguanylate cyclase (GGDEF)-like protein